MFIDQLRMAGYPHNLTLLNANGLSAIAHDDVCASANTDNARRADKHGSESLMFVDAPKSALVYPGFETIDLSPPGISLDRHIEPTKGLKVSAYCAMCSQNQTGAGR